MEASLKQVAALVEGVLEGADPEHKINNIKALEDAGPEHLSFLANPRYARLLPACRAGAVLVSREQEVPPGLGVIRVDNPYLAYAQILTMAVSRPYQASGVHPTAVVDAGARIGREVSIHAQVRVGAGAIVGDRVVLHPGVCLQAGAQVGDDSILYPNVTVYHDCVLGRRCIVHAGAVIGADGFGFVPGEVYYKIPQIGIVQIDDDVEIGANTTIDRAALGRTWIQRGVKIDNLVHIAHNCVVGEGSVIVAQVGVSGSTKLGRRVVLGGQVGLVGHITVGDGAQVGAQSGLLGSLEAGATVMGSPAMPLKLYMKTAALCKRLPEFFERLKKLEKNLNLEKNQEKSLPE
jgi:UDP-3-O-[3-hydroxymyristoyl] glucosamine N-acyltransferase